MAVKAKGPQIKFLKDYLERLNREKNVFSWREVDIDFPVPKAVLAAQKRIERDGAIVDAFEEKKRAKAKEVTELLRAEYRKCQREIFFGDPANALKMLDAFAAMKF